MNLARLPNTVRLSSCWFEFPLQLQGIETIFILTILEIVLFGALILHPLRHEPRSLQLKDDFIVCNSMTVFLDKTSTSELQELPCLNLSQMRRERSKSEIILYN